MVMQCWRTIAGDELTWRSLEGDYVVYAALSGHTHVLDILSGEVLRAILEGQHGSEALEEVVARFLEVPVGPELAATLKTVIDRLKSAGLIEEHPDCR